MQSESQRLSADKRQRHTRAPLERFISDDAQPYYASCGAHAIILAQPLGNWTEPLSQVAQLVGDRG